MAATVLTNVGRALLASRAAGSGNPPAYIRWGVGTGRDALVTDTGLIAAGVEAHVAGTATCVQGNAGSGVYDTFQITATVTASAAQTITEGVVETSDPVCFLHATFPGIGVSVGDRVAFTFKLGL